MDFFLFLKETEVLTLQLSSQIIIYSVLMVKLAYLQLNQTKKNTHDVVNSCQQQIHGI